MTKEPSYVSGESRTRGREGVVRRQGSQVDWAAGLVVMVLVLFFGVPLWMFDGNVQKPDSAIGRTPSAPPAASQPALNTPAEMSEQLQKDIYRSVWHEKEAWYAAQVWDWDRCPPASTPEPQLLSQIEPCATEVREAEQRLEEALQRQGVSRAQWREIETQAALNNWPPPPPEPWKALTEQARKEIFRSLVLAQESSKPAREARERAFVPKRSSEPWIAFHRRRFHENRAQDKVLHQSEDTTLVRYEISRAQLQQIKIEAAIKKWNIDDPEFLGSATASSRSPQPRGTSITAAERQRLQAMPYGSGCLKEALIQAPPELDVVALAEACIAMMVQREKYRR